MTTTLLALVMSKGYVVADGAMGTQLFAAGLSAGWSPEEWNLSHPDEIRAVHRGYLQAGRRPDRDQQLRRQLLQAELARPSKGGWRS